MIYKYFLLCVALISCSERTSEFSWPNVEKQLSEKAKRNILIAIDDKLVAGYIVMAEEIKSNEIFSLFHFVDLNQDGLDDIVFNGYGGAANEYIMIFTNSNNGYMKKMHRYGHIESVSLKDSTLLKIRTVEFVGEDSGDSLMTYKVIKDRIELASAIRIK